jgi:2,4-dienoyl-CoA reductase-like NADH-dependent reductase (Old Yellow Enzyme family)
MALAPMNETLSGDNGQATMQTIAYFAARAKGGAAMLVTGAIMGTQLASRFVWGRNLYCFHQGHVIGLKMLTDHIHYFGSLACAQMTIGFGRQGHSADHHELAPAPTGGLPYEIAMETAPKPIEVAWRKIEHPRSFLVGQMTREMSIDEIHSEQKEFARSCQLIVVSGFDAIEIHAPHGYLEHPFLSPLSNKRTDMYGGEWRNRKRFLIEVTEQVRYAVGSGVALGVRISAEEHTEGGLTREEMIDLAKDLEACGIDYLSLSDGAGYEEGGHLVPDKDRAKHIPEHGRDFKKAIKIPVMVASQHDPVKADNDIGDGMFDISALGRQLFIDPEYPNKIAENRPKDIEFCRRCDTCLGLCLAGPGPACPYNPELGREYANPEFAIGPRADHELIMPRGMLPGDMPALDRPWWKPEFPTIDKRWRAFRGPGKR